MHTSQRSSATEYVQCILTSLVGSEVGGEVVDVDENTLERNDENMSHINERCLRTGSEAL